MAGIGAAIGARRVETAMVSAIAPAYRRNRSRYWTTPTAAGMNSRDRFRSSASHTVPSSRGIASAGSGRVRPRQSR